jgi:ABC-type multidrug transport system ATPase subunit
MHALQTLVEGRTVLTISHRLSTLGHVDEIIVLHQGRIVEHGTYNELKAAGGVFAWLLAEQNRYNLDHREDQVPLRPAQDPADVGPQSALSPNGRRPQPSRALPVGARAVGGGG